MSNTDGVTTFPANPYSFAGEYGPAATDIRNRVTAGGSINFRWGVRISPFVVVQSGMPFDITTGNDPYGTTIFNARPGIATDPNKPGVIQTAYGLLDPNPTAGERIVSRNSGRGPGQHGKSPSTQNKGLIHIFRSSPETNFLFHAPLRLRVTFSPQPE